MTKAQTEILITILRLGRLLVSIQPVLGGLLHKMWRIETDKGVFAVKKLSANINFDEKTRNSYELSERIASLFAEEGVPAVKSLRHDNHSLIEIDRAIFIVYPWVEAKILGSDDVGIKHVKIIATLLAKMHSLNIIISEFSEPEFSIYSKETLTRLIATSLDDQQPFAHELDRAKEILLQLNQNYHQAIPKLKIKQVVSHGDLDPKNVLWDAGGNPFIIDWESSRLVNPSYELINAALDWSGVTAGRINDDLFLAMINTYKDAGGQINSSEYIDMLYGVCGNWINWLVFNIERSLHNTADEERSLGVSQVKQTFKTLLYLNSNIESLTSLIG